MSHPFQPPVETMEAKVSEKWPKGEFVYEPKWDGFRSISWSEPDLRLDSRNKRPLLRYFPDLRPALSQLPPGTVVDGEIVVVIDGVTEFDALQQRIHPAESRINLLAEQTPAELVAFDLLADRGEDLRETPFLERRQRLVDLASELEHPWHLTPETDSEETARNWFHEFEPAGCDGIIAKRAELAYQHGKRAMIKIKHRRTIDVVVGGFREHKDGGKIGSLLLGLYNDNGDFTSSGTARVSPTSTGWRSIRGFSSSRRRRVSTTRPGHPGRRVVGRRGRTVRGLQSSPGWWLRSAMTSWRAIGSATPRASTVGDRTRTPLSARWTSSSVPRASASRRSWRADRAGVWWG
jgi:ATP-dependent DNA ligase